MPKPSGPQFISVFHSSDSDTPPHLQEADDNQKYDAHDNVHPDIVHMGTRAAAQNWPMRQHLHEYKINVNHPSVSAVTFGESPTILEKDQDMEHSNMDTPNSHTAYQELYNHFQDRMSGKQPGLFEETSPDTKDVATRGIVTPYRNRREDAGSTSWMVPKSQVGDEGAVQYVRHFKPRKIVR